MNKGAKVGEMTHKWHRSTGTGLHYNIQSIENVQDGFEQAGSLNPETGLLRTLRLKLSNRNATLPGYCSHRY
jgi:hypothetical protein